MDISVGSDVEFFLREAKGQYVSAEGYVKGTKADPYRFDEHEPWFATQLDNVLAEGNIPPARTAADFVAHMGKLRRYLDSTLPATLRTDCIAAVKMSPEFLATPNAQNFGCDPSYNAWTDALEEVVCQDPQLRSAGFHIHVGYKPPSVEMNLAIARSMDLFLGVPSVILDPEARLRRDGGYGAAGNFRHQPHGVEYRTLSSAMAASPSLLEWAFENTQRAVIAAEQKLIESEPLLRSGHVIQDVINRNMTTTALELIRKYAIPMPGVPK